MSNEDYIKEFGMAQTLSRMNLMKDWMELDNNANYQTIDTASYKKALLYYHSPSATYANGVTSEERVDMWVENIIDDEVYLESKFITDSSLVYESATGNIVVRGTIYFIYYHDNELKEGRKLNTWYKCDCEVTFSYKLEQSSKQYLWEHSDRTYAGFKFLSEEIEVGE
jgi:hypothetical protein